MKHKCPDCKSELERKPFLYSGMGIYCSKCDKWAAERYFDFEVIIPTLRGVEEARKENTLVMKIANNDPEKTQNKNE
jgi:hypothetical protein